MPDIQKLHLEDALEDGPQTRSLLGVFERDALMLKKYCFYMHKGCQRILNAQNEMTAATQALAHHLRAYELSKFPFETDDSILVTTLKQFANYMDELSSVHQVLATQMTDTMMYPLTKFIQADLEELSTIGQMYQMSGNEHEQAIARYMKLPKRRDNEKLRMEANEDLYAMRKKFHQTAMHYYSSLNALQYKRKCSLLEPLIGYMQSQKTFFGMGHDAVAKTHIDDFLCNISASVQSVHNELDQETQKTVEMIDSLESQSQHLYYAELPQEMPYIPPNPSLYQKSGYLFLRSKANLLATTKWDRCYFFTQGGNLMCQHKDEVAGSLQMDLNEDGVVAAPLDIDDRRSVFQIYCPVTKKTVIVQAENDTERDEWIATINNIAKDISIVKDKLKKKERERTSSGSHGSTKKNSVSGAAAHASRERINPFDQSTADIVTDKKIENAAFCQTFEVRFLGSMEVKHDRGDPLVLETIRQVMAARAIHNIFRTTESHLLVSSVCMRLIDPSNNSIRTEFRLEDISYWAAHTENKRLFGFITRSRGDTKDSPTTYACHVFECNTSGEEICTAISAATKLAFQALMDKKGNQPPQEGNQKEAQKEEAEEKKQTEKEILLANINQLEDKPSASEPTEPRVSADGKYMLLENNQSEDSPGLADPNPPVRQEAGDGDERKVEGAECESEA